MRFSNALKFVLQRKRKKGGFFFVDQSPFQRFQINFVIHFSPGIAIPPLGREDIIYRIRNIVLSVFYRAFPGAVPGMVHNARQRGQPRCYNFSFLKLCQNIYDTPFTTGDRRSSWWRSIVSQWCLFFRPCRQQGVLFLFFFFENFRETKCNDLRLNFYTLFFLLETILSFIYFLKFDVKGGGGEMNEILGEGRRWNGFRISRTCIWKIDTISREISRRNKSEYPLARVLSSIPICTSCDKIFKTIF